MGHLPKLAPLGCGRLSQVHLPHRRTDCRSTPALASPIHGPGLSQDPPRVGFEHRSEADCSPRFHRDQPGMGLCRRNLLKRGSAGLRRWRNEADAALESREIPADLRECYLRTIEIRASWSGRRSSLSERLVPRLRRVRPRHLPPGRRPQGMRDRAAPRSRPPRPLTNRLAHRSEVEGLEPLVDMQQSVLVAAGTPPLLVPEVNGACWGRSRPANRAQRVPVEMRDRGERQVVLEEMMTSANRLGHRPPRVPATPGRDGGPWPGIRPRRRPSPRSPQLMKLLVGVVVPSVVSSELNTYSPENRRAGGKRHRYRPTNRRGRAVICNGKNWRIRHKSDSWCIGIPRIRAGFQAAFRMVPRGTFDTV